MWLPRSGPFPSWMHYLSGPTAIIVGGNNPSGVAKVICDFFQEEKVELKAGVLNDRTLNKEDRSTLKTSSLEVLRAQLLGLLTQLDGLCSSHQCSSARPRQCFASKSTKEKGEDA